MKRDILLRKLRDKFEVKTNAQLAKNLGLTSAVRSKYREELSEENVARMVSRAWDTGGALYLEYGIVPIVELFPIRASSSKQGKSSEILPPTEEASEAEDELRESLKEAKGIYLFYNSEGRVIYVGKTEKNDLWSEMKQAFNREMAKYKLFQVDRATEDGELLSPLDAKLQIRKRQSYLHGTVRYFSAYRVEPQLISNLEAFIIRALPNDLLNVKMENFKYPSSSWHGEP